MSSPTTQLAHLQKRINDTIEEFASAYPFLTEDSVKIRRGREDDVRSSDELTLDALVEIRESLAA